MAARRRARTALVACREVAAQLDLQEREPTAASAAGCRVVVRYIPRGVVHVVVESGPPPGGLASRCDEYYQWSMLSKVACHGCLLIRAVEVHVGDQLVVRANLRMLLRRQCAGPRLSPAYLHDVNVTAEGRHRVEE